MAQIDPGNYIGEMDLTSPSGTDLRSDMDDSDRDIKRMCKQSFPNILNVVTKDQDEINDGAEKSAAQTITGDWTFQGTYSFEAGFVSTTGVFTDGPNRTDVGPVDIHFRQDAVGA